MTKSSTVPILIIGYQRPENVERILDFSYENDVAHILISIDGPKNLNDTSIEISASIRKIVSKYEKKFKNFDYRYVDKNLGCALHILNSIDWAFEKTSELIILEDDCIPSSGFLHFMKDGLGVMEVQDDIALVCGTQHVPLEISAGRCFKSKYSLTWGWGTTKKNWLEIRKSMKVSSLSTPWNLLSFDPGKVYWHEGSRRAFEGYVDVWDTPLVNYLQVSTKYALLPGSNLITNIGNDRVATHMRGDSRWLFNAVEEYRATDSLLPVTNSAADEWLSKYFYRISMRHLLSTRITRCKDFFFRSPRKNLMERWFEE